MVADGYYYALALLGAAVLLGWIAGTFWALPARSLELSVMIRAALSAAVVEGVKITEIVQDAVGANCPPAALQVSPGPSEKSPVLLPVNP